MGFLIDFFPFYHSFFFPFLIDSYFLTPTVNVHVFNPTVGLAICTGTLTNKQIQNMKQITDIRHENEKMVKVIQYTLFILFIFYAHQLVMSFDSSKSVFFFFVICCSSLK